MPWCPKCKTEYREGFTICVDCNTELVDQLDATDDYEKLVSFEKEEVADKFLNFLDYSGIHATIKTTEEEEQYFTVFVKPEDVKKAKRCFNAFYTVEAENESKDASSHKATTEKFLSPEDEVPLEENSFIDDETLTTDNTYADDNIFSEDKAFSEDEDFSEDEASVKNQPSGAYVKKSEQYQDLKSTAVTFLVFGFGGIIVLILNALDVISFFSGPLAYGVMAFMFLGFLYVGFNSISRSKKAAKEAIQEEELTTTINAWLEEHVTEQLIKELQDDSISKEINFMKTMDAIKAMVTKELGDMDDSYLDAVVEEYYNNRFEAN